MGAFFFGPLLEFFEEGATDAQASVVRGDVDVLDGGPSFGLEGEGAFAQLPREEADHLPLSLSDEEARVAVRGEFGEEAVHDFLGIESGGIDEVIEGVLLSALYPKPGSVCSIVPLSETDGKRDIVWAFSWSLFFFAVYVHGPIV